MSCDSIHMMDCCLFILIAADNLSESVFGGRKLGVRREGSREAGQGTSPSCQGGPFGGAATLRASCMDPTSLCAANPSLLHRRRRWSRAGS